MNDFFVEQNYILEHSDRIGNIPITIVQGRHDLIVPIKSAWKLYKQLSNCEMFIIENGAHSDSSVMTLKKLKEVANKHLEYM